MYRISWLQNLDKSDKLRSYRIFKKAFGFEKYLSLVNSVMDRVSLSRLRTSSHKLHIETGRYTTPKTEVENRICKNCNLNLIEDEKHFLLVCPKFNDSRKELLDKCFNNNVTVHSSTESKFLWLLSNEDSLVCKSVAKFINHCSLSRNTN